ncbi:class I glutamine amidotransferase-like protein [Elsinoe ampelina]|uniref:Class I glutamine amidotransferase-like protein n=1 Tax=Elsinoe ampelina TaxID=302913 RepID=A0A6A6GNQ2_9PEZI|nr:class I glutamine amidotransferase-like protein [Elsinoe ampelina]
MIDLRNPSRTIHVGVLLANGMTETLDIAPVDILYSLSNDFLAPMDYLPDHIRSQGLDIKFHWVTENGEDGDVTSGIKIRATDSFTTCPPLDILLIGAHWSTKQSTGIPNEAELAFVRDTYQHCTALISICAGMITPLRAGLLEGKTCTAPRILLANIRKENPGVKWVEKRHVKAEDGKIWTGGTLLNGLDLMRAFVQETWGGEGSLAESLLTEGAWPVRDVDYRDVD